MLCRRWICWGPTMTVIADKCPDLEITVVDMNEEKIENWNDESFQKFQYLSQV